jgi:hypothetical protein
MCSTRGPFDGQVELKQNAPQEQQANCVLHLRGTQVQQPRKHRLSFYSSGQRPKVPTKFPSNFSMINFLIRLELVDFIESPFFRKFNCLLRF